MMLSTHHASTERARTRAARAGPKDRAALWPLRARIATALVIGAVACVAPARDPETVVYASGADLESANPLVTVHSLSRQLQRYALFVTLARYDSALAPEPYFAHSWRWEENRRVLELSLDTTLYWHDGRPTTARDVLFTLDAARDSATGYPRYADLSTIAELAAPDDRTVRLTFSIPPASFPPVLCELPILPAHLLAGVPRPRMRQAAYNLDPVGNGPFRFHSRTAGQRWVFVRNDRFPPSLGGRASIERLVIAVVDEPTTKFAGLVSGELDVAGIAPTMAALAERGNAMRVLSYPVLVSYALVFNVTRPPFDDERVRTAVSAAIDRQRIVDAALAGFATPAFGPVPPSSPFAMTLPATDPRSADSLLDAAGWRRGGAGWRAKGGKTLGFTLLTVGSGDNALEQLLQADLRERGVRVEIRQLELGAFLAAARAREKTFDALITGIPGDLSLSHLAAMYDSRLAGGALDYGGFHTPTLDAAFRRAREARSESDLRTAWSDVQRELHERAPAVWIYHARGVQGISRRLKGVRMDLRGEMVTLPRWTVGEGDTTAR